MDKAKEAVRDFMHKAGHHDTTVHEKVAPAVVNETVQKVRKDEIQTAVDREIHQDHYHTSIQPVKAREVLPEEHRHNMAQVQERHIDHGDDAAIRRRLEEERAQFRDTRTEAATVHTQENVGTVAGEHVHHHGSSSRYCLVVTLLIRRRSVHETIQPVVQKEVIQPSVVHTTVPIHEVHHNEAKHHAVSALPAVSLSEFQRHGGTLSGREERIDGFEGEPKAVGSTLGGSTTTGTSSGYTGSSTGTTGSTTGTSGLSSGHHGHSTGASADAAGYSGRGGTDGIPGSGTTGSTTGSGPVHSSRLLNKLDPRVDADGDGRRGVGQ
ncbi:MAG: hypothetical protein M1826_000331 [Phylliscum demangeonii]|nr:MAG: hypothetical protein M1826_000331 [Phylliscum demangeonii]